VLNWRAILMAVLAWFAQVNRHKSAGCMIFTVEFAHLPLPCLRSRAYSGVLQRWMLLAVPRGVMPNNPGNR
jgi:hypothetical protein